MMKRKIFMVANGVDVNKGGITSVMLSRTHLFHGEIYDPTIVTLDDLTNYREIEDQLKEDGRLEKQSSITNIYEFYRNKFSNGEINESIQKQYEENNVLEEDGFHYQKEEDFARYFKNGRYVKYKKWDDEGRLVLVDYFSEMRVRVTREEYHPDGYLLKKITYHPANNQMTQVHYYTPEGFCYMSRWFNPKTEKQMRVVLFKPDKQDVKVFSSNLEFHSYFLDELCTNEQLKPIVICDGPGTAKRVQEMNEEVAYRIFTLHSNHLEAPHTLGSEVKSAHKPILENTPEGTHIVVLTNRQKLDIETQFSERKWHLNVISNAVSSELREVKRQDNLAVVVSRYSAEKRLDLIIQAFKKTLEDVPDAKLHFYGEGNEKPALMKLIKKLKLSRAVKLYNYTKEAEKHLGSALFTVLTSTAEGQSLALLEAMSQKTPAITFNINYIVKEVVDGKCGVVVKDGDVDALANEMTEAFYEPERMKALGEAGYEIAKQEYSQAKQYERWQTLFEKIITE